MAASLRIVSGGCSAYMKSLPKSKRRYGTAPTPDFIEPQLAKLVDCDRCLPSAEVAMLEASKAT